nr:MAG TPA: hypothetical protein [Bacteriophage sp.]
MISVLLYAINYFIFIKILIFFNRHFTCIYIL